MQEKNPVMIFREGRREESLTRSSGPPPGPLASGHTAEVFEFSPGYVVKLFRAWVPEADVESERRKAAAVHALGVPTPAVGEIVRWDGRIGLVFERITGSSMLKEMMGDPGSIGRLAREMAALHRSIHDREGPFELPSQREVLQEKIAGCPLLSEAQRRAVLGVLACLPDGDRLCHGDFHPGNVLVTARGPVIIDWVDASRGNPLADVARTSVLTLGHVETRVAQGSVKASIRLFYRTYLDAYFERDPRATSEYEEYEKWLLVMTAARLADGLADEREWLLERIRQEVGP